MDATRFDEFTRTLHERGWSRRRLTSIVATGLLSGLPMMGVMEGTVKGKKKKKRKKTKKNGGQSVNPPAPPVSAPGQSPPPPASPCARDCTGKACGNDGCGGACGVCGNEETCNGGQCVAANCNPPCTSNHLCQNGACVCPPGLHECPGPGYLARCHECCVDAFTGPPDQECNDSPNGEFCLDDDGDFVFRCGCLSGLVLCNDGRCGECCNDGFCLATQGQGRFCNANHVCDCPAGQTWCSAELGCHDTKTDKNACGPNCTDCGPGWECQNSSCCIGLASDCTMDGHLCCAGLQCVNIGTVFEPVMVCA